MRYNIIARQTNANTADGYSTWEYVDEWNADSAEDAIYEWMDDMQYNDNRFVQTSDHSYCLDDREYDVKAEPESEA